jgi:sodium transport system ATP-binding protein
MIEARGLRKRFGGTVAVEDVSFTAQDGRITGLLGPNGAGKTTTFRMISGILRPDGGGTFIDGVETGGSDGGSRRSLGTLPESYGLYGRLTARENIAYFARLRGVPRQDIERVVDGLIKLLDMGGIADRRAGGFSQGERVKVALARALVHDPRNILLDEPTRGLDVMSIRAIRALLTRLKNEGRCVLLSSHIMQEVEALCDRIVVMARGKVVADAAPTEVRRIAGVEELEDAFVQLVASP